MEQKGQFSKGMAFWKSQAQSPEQANVPARSDTKGSFSRGRQIFTVPPQGRSKAKGIANKLMRVSFRTPLLILNQRKKRQK